MMHRGDPSEKPTISSGRVILHADMDAFFASVEQLDNPQLRGRPVVVGGSAEGRGVVAAASYEARVFGIRSAMPMSRAMRLCPEAIGVSPRFARYAELSRQVMAIFRTLTPLVEPISLDEAFLDVSARLDDPAGAIALARELKAQVRATTGLTISVGEGANKTVAKIASDMGKPDGLVIVPPGEERAFLAPLPVRALWGIGPKAEEALLAGGIRTIDDLATGEGERLRRLLGSRWEEAQRMARGEDSREVHTARERKSVGAETTFSEDLPDGPELQGDLDRIALGVAQRLAAHELHARTIALKLRYSDFRTIGRQTTLRTPTDDPEEIRRAAEALLAEVVRPGDHFRLLGIQCANLSRGADVVQLPLWAGPH